MGQDAAKYTYRVRWSEEDGEYLATVAEFPSLSWLDKDQAMAFTGIVDLVKEVVKDMLANGENVPKPLSLREYSGNVRLRMPPEQHRELAIRAAEEGVSLNRLLCSLIARPVIAMVNEGHPEPSESTPVLAGTALSDPHVESVTVSTRVSQGRGHLKLVQDGGTVDTATTTERYEAPRSYDSWPEEM